jgi:RNA polymerase sigma factor (sigma-70 family)
VLRDDKQFEEWWSATAPRLKLLAERYSRSSAEALDLVQDVAVLALLEARRAPNSEKHGWQDVDHFQRWTHVRLRWRAIDIRRHEDRFRSERFDERSVGKIDDDPFDDASVRDLIDKLPDRQRAVIVDSLNGLSVGDIAKKLNVKEATVRSLQRFARIRISKMLVGKDRGR